jgi:hypothetical protein
MTKAVARPIPEEAPVTMATLFLSIGILKVMKTEPKIGALFIVKDRVLWVCVLAHAASQQKNKHLLERARLRQHIDDRAFFAHRGQYQRIEERCGHIDAAVAHLIVVWRRYSDSPPQLPHSAR